MYSQSTGTTQGKGCVYLPCIACPDRPEKRWVPGMEGVQEIEMDFPRDAKIFLRSPGGKVYTLNDGARLTPFLCGSGGDVMFPGLTARIFVDVVSGQGTHKDYLVYHFPRRNASNDEFLSEYLGYEGKGPGMYEGGRASLMFGTGQIKLHDGPCPASGLKDLKMPMSGGSGIPEYLVRLVPAGMRGNRTSLSWNGKVLFHVQEPFKHSDKRFYLNVNLGTIVTTKAVYFTDYAGVDGETRQSLSNFVWQSDAYQQAGYTIPVVHLQANNANGHPQFIEARAGYAQALGAGPAALGAAPAVVPVAAPVVVPAAPAVVPVADGGQAVDFAAVAGAPDDVYRKLVLLQNAAFRQGQTIHCQCLLIDTQAQLIQDMRAELTDAVERIRKLEASSDEANKRARV